MTVPMAITALVVAFSDATNGIGVANVVGPGLEKVVFGVVELAGLKVVGGRGGGNRGRAGKGRVWYCGARGHESCRGRGGGSRGRAGKGRVWCCGCCGHGAGMKVDGGVEVVTGAGWKRSCLVLWSSRA